MNTHPTQSTTPRATGNDAHTPTPWKIVNGTEIISLDELNVADAYPTEDRLPGRETGEADAAFIVSACNSHAALVEALEDAADYVNYLADSGNKDAEKSALRIEAAIALARGEKGGAK